MHSATRAQRARRRGACSRLHRARPRRLYRLSLSTALPALAVELHSSYLGYPGAHAVLAANLGLACDAGPLTWSNARCGADLPVTEVRRGCLYDHVLELLELLSEEGRPREVDVRLADEALELVDVA